MAKNSVLVTNSYQLVASGPVVITVKSKGSGALLFDENQSDFTAYRTDAPVGDQFQETEARPTYVRSTGEGWRIIVDGEL
jgi:hypothetical protein